MHLPVLENHIHDAPASCDVFANESRMLKKYLEHLAQCDRPEVLDLGPVCGNNISFFLDRVSKLHVCDAYSHFVMPMKQDSDMEKNLSLFDYKESSFDGIHLWDLPDHCENRMLWLLVRKLHTLLKPKGMLIMIASNTSVAQPFPLYFAIRDDGAVMLQKTTAQRLSYFYRSNRDIEQSMKPFRQINSFICTNGIREFIYKVKQ
jgi:hypothetical protein